MAKRISKDINSKFNPTFVGGYPVYAYGGRMYSFGSWLKSNSGNLLQTGLGIGAMFIPGMQGVGASMIGNGVSGMATTGDSIGDQQKAMYDQQREALKQMQLDKIANLPGQHYSESQQTMGCGGKMKKYASGGGLSRSEDYGSKKKPYPSVKSSDFAGKGRSYPIPTRADAVDALRLAGLHDRSDVRAKVLKKYPGLKKAYGGTIGDLDFTTFLNTGGTHETNPNGGIPVGKNALVEEGEYIWDGPDGKYVFSNRF